VNDAINSNSHLNEDVGLKSAVNMTAVTLHHVY